MSQEITGELVVTTASGAEPRVRIDSAGANVWAGGNGADGDLVLFRNNGDNSTLSEATIHLDGQNGNMWAGGNGSDGDLVLFPTTSNHINDLGQATVHLDGAGSQLQLKSGGQRRVRLDGRGGNLWLGGNGADGDLVMFRTGGDNATLAQASVHIDAQGANIWAGGHGADGDLVLFPSTANNINDLSQSTIHLDGQSGDIRLSGADCAENFSIGQEQEICPGSVMVVGDADHLEICERAYDKRVAGVVSGAGNYRPGILLDKGNDSPDSVPLALVGKVYCQVDADYGPIQVGDMLTTSPTAGHAMKVSDPGQAFGAVLGKALREHTSGKGLIPILVALQ